jgi:UDP-N-acetylmuramate--alanine ligase
VLSGVELGDSSLVMGERDYFVYEACEYRDSFLSMMPNVAVATNIELDHTDYFGSLDALCRSFRLSLLRADVAIINMDDKNSRSLLDISSAVSFGKDRSADFWYSTPVYTPDGIRFSLTYRERSINIKLHSFMPHDAANATAAIAAVCSSGIDFARLDGCLDSFRGIGRRCELLRYVFGRPVYYDYAHHPTEIESTLRAVRDRHGACTVIFRPHTYSRTRDLWEGFVRSLSLADFAVLVDVYAARETPVEGVDSETLARAVGGVYLPSSAVADYVVNNCVGAIVLMGAGDVEDIKKSLEEY